MVAYMEYYYAHDSTFVKNAEGDLCHMTYNKFMHLIEPSQPPWIWFASGISRPTELDLSGNVSLVSSHGDPAIFH